MDTKVELIGHNGWLWQHRFIAFGMSLAVIASTVVTQFFSLVPYPPVIALLLAAFISAYVIAILMIYWLSRTTIKNVPPGAKPNP